MVIQPQFEDASSFDPNGLALIKLNEKWGYINEAGEMVIQPQFEDACSFASNGLALITLNGKKGYINEAGEMVIQPQFESATFFTIIFHSNVKRVKHVQEKAAEERRIAEEKAAEERRIAEEKAAEERRIAEEKARQKAAQQANWRTAGLCQHCGGELKGFFSKKCTVCGKPKDY